MCEQEGESTSWLKAFLSRGAKDQHWEMLGVLARPQRAMVTVSQELVVGCGWVDQMCEIKNGGSAKFGSSRVSQILQLPYQASALRLLKNFDFFKSFLMNECSVDSVELFRFEKTTKRAFFYHLPQFSKSPSNLQNIPGYVSNRIKISRTLQHGTVPQMI